MTLRFSLVLMAALTMAAGARAADGATPDTTDAQNATSQRTTPVPMLPGPFATIAAVHTAMAEEYHPAPLPDENNRAPGERIADAGPSLHPAALSEKTAGALTDSNIDYDRNQRVRPAGGMSLDIPVQ